MDFGFDDDPRGFKKKKSAFQKFQAIWGKLSWVVLAVLFLLFWRLTHHHKSLKAETQQHIEEKERYLDQIGHLDSHVRVKSQEVKTLERLHDQAAQNADHHQTRAQQLEAEHQRLEAESLHETGQLNNKLQAVQAELQSCHHALEGERHIIDALHDELEEVKNDKTATAALQAEVDKLKIQLEYATQLAKGAAAGAGKGAPGGRSEEQARRQAQDDAVDAAILKKANKAAAEDTRAQAQQGRRPDAGAQRGGGETPHSVDPPSPTKQAQPAHHEEEAPQQQQQNEDAGVRAPSSFRRKRPTKRRGGLSMLEEHLGIEHDEGEVVDEQRGEGQERAADHHVPIGRIPHRR